MCCSTVDADGSASAFALDHVSVETFTVGDIVDVYTFVLDEIGGFDKVFVDLNTSDIVQVRMRNTDTMDFRFKDFDLHNSAKIRKKNETRNITYLEEKQMSKIFWLNPYFSFFFTTFAILHHQKNENQKKYACIIKKIVTMDHDEHFVIEGLKQGANWAYKHIYDTHYVLLCKIALSFLKDVFLAQTLVNDLIIHIYEKRETLLINTSLRAYLVQAVRNRCLNYLELKHQKREVKFSTMDTSSNERLLSIDDKGDYPLATLLEKELEHEIRLAIERLPDDCRTVLKKSRFEEKSYKEIAAEMAISVNTVKYHIKNALAQLRKDLGKFLLLLLSCLPQNFTF